MDDEVGGVPGYVREQAGQIVANLMTARQPDDGIATEGVALADVEDDVNSFTTQLEVLSDVGLDVPALAVRSDREDSAEVDVIPLSLDSLARPYEGFWGAPASADLWDPRFPRYWPRSFVRDVIQRRLENAEQSTEGFTTVSRETAERQFRRRLTDFLGTRIWATFDDRATGWPGAALMRLPLRRGGKATTVPGCTFVVSTNSVGLHVFWTGAYFLRSREFGYPTSPTSSTLQAGTYVFGVTGGAYVQPVTWDQNAVVTLPGTPSVHLSF